MLIEYYCVGSDVLAFVRRGAEVELRTVAAVEDVEALVDKLSFQIGKCSLGAEYVMGNLETLRKGIDRCLRSLYRQVIGPIEDLLEQGDRLIVVPHGALHGLPFHAFHDGEGYLVDRYAITVAPSAAVLHACRQVARPIGERALVVGIDDPGLPMVRSEVEAIGRTWETATVALGARATSRVLKRHVGGFDVLHLATHGVFRADNPSFSSIKLADAWLTVRDLAELARGAQLVTLSACETGVSGLAAGDEVLGLTRGLLGAGLLGGGGEPVDGERREHGAADGAVLRRAAAWSGAGRGAAGGDAGDPGAVRPPVLLGPLHGRRRRPHVGLLNPIALGSEKCTKRAARADYTEGRGTRDDARRSVGPTGRTLGAGRDDMNEQCYDDARRRPRGGAASRRSSASWARAGWAARRWTP